MGTLGSGAGCDGGPDGSGGGTLGGAGEMFASTGWSKSFASCLSADTVVSPGGRSKEFGRGCPRIVTRSCRMEVNASEGVGDGISTS